MARTKTRIVVLHTALAIPILTNDGTPSGAFTLLQPGDEISPSAETPDAFIDDLLARNVAALKSDDAAPESAPEA